MVRSRLMLALCACALWGAEDTRGYHRFPAVRGDQVVFTSEGDLWTAPLAGGVAARLTTHPGEESRAAFSPDGAWIAFTASYEGSPEAYVMAAAGGVPKRLSFGGGRVLGWSPQGEVAYVTQAPQGASGQTVVACVHPATGAQRVLPLMDANEVAFDEAGKTVFFTRQGLQITGDNARHYRGGAAAELWRFDLAGRAEAQRLDLPAPAKRPMWWKGRLYFVSDHQGLDNLWSCTAEGRDLKQHTRHGEFEVRGATLGEGRIVYQHGADLRVFDVTLGQDRVLPLQLRSDFDQARQRFVKQAMVFQGDASLAPSGERVVLSGRGRVAVAAAGALRRVDIAIPEGSRAKDAVLSKDGAWVYAICDATGEQEIWRFPASGAPGGKALTTDGRTQRTGLMISPDGQWLAHTDRMGRLALLNPATGENRPVDAHRGGIYELVWSPDSKALAYVRSDTARESPQVVVYGLDTRKAVVATSDRYPCSSPAFSPDGRWLFFLSDRHFQAVNGSPWGDRNMGPFFDKRTKVYALALQGGLRWPFKAKDELDAPEANGKGGDKASSKGAALPAIQWEGLAQRLHEAPLPPANYRAVRCDGKRIFVLEREQGPGATLKTLDLGPEARKPSVYMTDLRGFELSPDGKKVLLVKARNTLHLVDAGPKPPSELEAVTVRTSDWSLTLDPRQEWRQIFTDAWRMHRDYLFDAKLRGADWKAVRRRYEPLVDRVRDRAELDDLLAQMSSEVGALHSQIRPGPARPLPENPSPAFLGAVTERVAEGERVARIYRTDPELPEEAAPLAKAGLKEGDVITQVNGRAVEDVRNLADLLRGQAGQQVLLAYRRGTETRQAVVVPVDGGRNANLRYGDWEEACRQKVEEEGKGDIGYLHLRAMGSADIATFAREFYAQFHRKGLVIDVRRNNGGNIDSWILEKLLRRAWVYWTHPDLTFRGTNMQQAFRGHLVVLIDERTYSDGETFAQGVKTLGLGPLVGRRTAGAGAWLTDSNVQVDGGVARAAEWPQFLMSTNQWVIEGSGVAPDVEVVNPPFETFQGRDRQLETALRMLKEKIAREPLPEPKPQRIPALKP